MIILHHMIQQYDFLALFDRFIRESKNGKRLKKNGERLSLGTIESYLHAYKLVAEFSRTQDFTIRFRNYHKLNTRERKVEKNYWKKFYRKFTDYLYKEKKCFDNYVGSVMKTIRTFFNYVRRDLDIPIGEYHLLFYVRNEQVAVTALSPERLRFLIHDQEFHNSLRPAHQNAKNIFVFGCAVSLRYSDIVSLTPKNIITQDGVVYLENKSKKTKTFTKVKLPNYTLDIVLNNPYKKKGKLFRVAQLHRFNTYLKEIGELAGWTEKTPKYREIRGKEKRVSKAGKEFRFCDLMSSHMMRRSSITNMLISGMPEDVVRTISGHNANSYSFYRYVQYSQAYADVEIEKFHNQLSQ